MDMIIVTGSNGLLGQALRKRVGLDPNYTWFNHQDFNIVDERKTQEFFAPLLQNHTDVLTVHLAAYTETRLAETEREQCYLTNVVGTRNIASVSPLMLYTSTDHVFDGKKGDYSESDEPCPWNQYGWTKLMGEREAQLVCKDRCKIIRCTFRAKPFPYPIAWTDVLTTTMWVDDMAEALHWCIGNFKRLLPILNIGGKKQNYHSFASENGPIVGGPSPPLFPKDLSLNCTHYTKLRDAL